MSPLPQAYSSFIAILLACSFCLTCPLPAASSTTPAAIRLIPTQRVDTGTTYVQNSSVQQLSSQQSTSTDPEQFQVDTDSRSVERSYSRSYDAASLSHQSQATFDASQRQRSQQDASSLHFQSAYTMTTTLDSAIHLIPAGNFFYINSAETSVTNYFHRSLRLVPNEPVTIHLNLEASSSKADFRSMRPTLLFGASPDSPYGFPPLPYFRLTNQNFFETTGTQTYTKSDVIHGIAYSLSGTSSANAVSLDITLTPDGSQAPWEMELRWVLQYQTKLTHGPYAVGSHVDSSTASLSFREDVSVTSVPECQTVTIIASAACCCLFHRRPRPAATTRPVPDPAAASLDAFLHPAPAPRSLCCQCQKRSTSKPLRLPPRRSTSRCALRRSPSSSARKKSKNACC